jgi:P-type Cu+ transporter
MTMRQHADTATSVDLAIEGMHCASCVQRVESRLSAVPGASATVNLATERAHVTSDASLDPDVLVRAVGDAGYSAHVLGVTGGEHAGAGEHGEHHEGHVHDSDGGSRPALRLVLSIVLTIPVVLLAMVPVLQFPGWQWVSLVLATPVVFWGGWPFHRSTIAGLRHGAVTMDTLVSMGTAAAYVWSVVALIAGGAGRIGMHEDFALVMGHDDGMPLYLEVASVVTTILLIGRAVERRSRRSAGAAMRALAELAAKDVSILDSEGLGAVERRVPADRLRQGELFLVRPGEKIAADGEVIGGAATIDRSMLTGESLPVPVATGSAVDAGTIPQGGSITVRATRVGTDTALARIGRLVEQAQQGKARVQRLADRVSAVFVPIVIGLSVLTLVAWLVSGAEPSFAFTAAISVLIIACPCALGLATPVALLVGTSRGAQLGILVTGPDAIERAGSVDTVVFDKTGTLTDGRMSVARVVAPGGDHMAVLALAASLEAGSEHPIGRAIVAASGGSRSAVTEFVALAALGVEGRVDGTQALVGTPDLMAQRGVEVGAAIERELENAGADGDTAVVVASDGVAVGVVVVRDAIRPESAATVAALRRLGVRSVLLTGDAEPVARRVAREVGIDDVRSQVSPARKAEVVAAFADDGHRAAMVGDGVNDAAALATADLGIAMGGGTDAAMAAADVTLVRDEVAAVVDAVRLSRRTIGVIRGNLFWAFAYNVAAIPLAAFGLLNPMIAGAAMAFSSIFVVLNSLRLRGFRTFSG